MWSVRVSVHVFQKSMNVIFYEPLSAVSVHHTAASVAMLIV